MKINKLWNYASFFCLLIAVVTGCSTSSNGNTNSDATDNSEKSRLTGLTVEGAATGLNPNFSP